MIHRIRGTDGADLGTYDHGVRGRANFLDAQAGQQSALPPVPFDPSTRARNADCASGRFDNSPDCWNLAPNGRRVWGVGVWRNSATNEVRLYYAAWSSPAFDPDGWLAADDADKRNSVWSVGIGADGSFIVSSVRREFLTPDFFVGSEEIARAGYSQPVSDIAFPACPGLPLMLVAERGGVRNLGLGEQAPFATPHEARAIRYELHDDGVWRPIGRYEIGFYDRANEGDPRMRANCAGGATFGPAYSNRWSTDRNKPDSFVWITADSLCSPDGPCNLAASGDQQSGDDSEVHGIQGLREDFYDEVAPASAYGLAPEQQTAAGQTTAVGPDESYLIDVNINMTPAGAPVVDEFVRNDSTLVGDIAVFQICAVQAAGVVYPLPPAPPVLIAVPGHDPNYSHARYGSHGQQQSHYRFASHWPAMSHQRFGSHNQYWSHYHYASHNLKWSHDRFGSHGNKASHNALGSHQPVASHFAKASKIHLLAASHKQFGSHNAKQSLIDKLKQPLPVPVHTLAKSALDKLKNPQPKHSIVKSVLDKGIKLPEPKPAHTLAKSVADKGVKLIDPVPVHTVAKSAIEKGLKLPQPKPAHSIAKSAIDKGVKIPEPAPAHTVAKSAIEKGVKIPEPAPAHTVAKSAIEKGVKIPQPAPAHTVAKSAVEKGVKIPQPAPAHAVAKSAIGKGVKLPQPKHNPIQSAAQEKLKQKTLEPVHAPANSAKVKLVPAPKNLPSKADAEPKAPPQPKVEKQIVLPKAPIQQKQKAPVQQLQQGPVQQKQKAPVQQIQKTPPKVKIQQAAPKPKHDPALSVKTHNRAVSADETGKKK
jgi:predicted peroxiredoxin